MENNWEKELVEKGAALEHDRWARWQKYFFGKCLLKPQNEVGGMDDRFTYFALPKNLYERWNRQIRTPYSELSEEEKESDRNETRNYIPLIAEALAAQKKELAERVRGMIFEFPDHYTASRNQALNDILFFLTSTEEPREHLPICDPQFNGGKICKGCLEELKENE